MHVPFEPESPAATNKTNPADECKKKGGTWDGQLAKTGRPTLSAPNTSPAEQCRKAGKFWDGKQCLGRAEQCRATGGVWDKATKTCKPATLVPRPRGKQRPRPGLGLPPGFHAKARRPRLFGHDCE